MPTQVNFSTQLRNKPVTYSAAFIFPSQACPENLSPSLRTITLAPVPPGINATNTNHYLAIFNNSGTFQEVVLINGGSAVAGAASGTLTFTSITGTYATGSYKIASATSGIQEAIWSSTATNTVVIPPNTSAPYTWPTYATITSGSTIKVSLVGMGSDCSQISPQFASGDAIYMEAGAGNDWIRTCKGIGIVPGVTRTSGSEFHLKAFRFGNVQDLYVLGGRIAFTFVDFISTLCDGLRSQSQTFRGIELLVSAGVVAGAEIANVNINVLSTANTAMLVQAVASGSFAGWVASNIALQGGVYNLYVDPNGGVINELVFTGLGCDSATGRSVTLLPSSGSGTLYSFTNLLLEPAVGGEQLYIGAGISTVKFSNVSGTKNGNVAGVTVDGASDVSLDNFSAYGGGNAGASDAGLVVGPGVVTGLRVSNSKFGDAVLGKPKIGLSINAAAHTGIEIANTDFNGAVSAISDLGLNPTIYSGWIGGLSDSIPTVADAATVTFPRMIQGGTVEVTGSGTAVTAVAGLYKGQSGFIQTASAITFTAGATIGTTVTTGANALTPFWFDGTKIWLR